MPVGNRYWTVHVSGLTSAYHGMVRMMFILLSCTGECGWKQSAIHSSRCLDRALGHLFSVSRLCLHASQTSTLILWAMLSPCRSSGCTVCCIDTLLYDAVWYASMCSQKPTNSQLNLTQVRIKTSKWRKLTKIQKKSPKCSQEVDLYIVIHSCNYLFLCGQGILRQW